MSYDIRYLPTAEDDLDSLANYLTRFYPGTAGRVLTEIEYRISNLHEHPLMYEVYRKDPFYRRVVVFEYLVFYHVNEKMETVDIHRILRGSTSIDDQLKR